MRQGRATLQPLSLISLFRIVMFTTLLPKGRVTATKLSRTRLVSGRARGVSEHVPWTLYGSRENTEKHELNQRNREGEISGEKNEIGKRKGP